MNMELILFLSIFNGGSTAYSFKKDLELPNFSTNDERFVI